MLAANLVNEKVCFSAKADYEVAGKHLEYWWRFIPGNFYARICTLQSCSYPHGHPHLYAMFTH